MPFTLANVSGRAALVTDGDWYDLERVSGGALGSDPTEAIARFGELGDIAAGLGGESADGSLADADLGAPSPRPVNSFGIGLNYRDHAAESNMDLPQSPVVFTKYPSCISGPDVDVELRTERGDYEAELVAVIGRTARDIGPDEVWDHLAGLTCGQDISDRKLQMAARPPHFGLGKSRDTYGPMGPVLVSIDSFADPADLAITCDVNGERRQDARTSLLIFDVPFLVSYLSEVMTLSPGDVIYTGTPAGVGSAQKKYLAPGDVIRTEIEGIGVMTNRCV